MTGAAKPVWASGEGVVIPLEGGWARIEAFSGKAYGQAITW